MNWTSGEFVFKWNSEKMIQLMKGRKGTTPKMALYISFYFDPDPISYHFWCTKMYIVQNHTFVCCKSGNIFRTKQNEILPMSNIILFKIAKHSIVINQYFSIILPVHDYITLLSMACGIWSSYSSCMHYHHQLIVLLELISISMHIYRMLLPFRWFSIRQRSAKIYQYNVFFW